MLAVSTQPMVANGMLHPSRTCWSALKSEPRVCGSRQTDTNPAADLKKAPENAKYVAIPHTTLVDHIVSLLPEATPERQMAAPRPANSRLIR